MRTHYDNLHITETAGLEVIKAAYRALAQKWHPDKNPDQRDSAERVFKIITRAYEVLSDPALRHKYDERLKEQRSVEPDEPEPESEAVSEQPIKSQSEKASEAWADGKRSREQGFNSSDCPYDGSMADAWQAGFKTGQKCPEQAKHRALKPAIVVCVLIALVAMITNSEFIKVTHALAKSAVGQDRAESASAVGPSTKYQQQAKTSQVDSPTARLDTPASANLSAPSQTTPAQIASEQGDVSAQYHLGVMYRDGQGVPRDDKEAVKWFRLAAEQGYADAQYRLGSMYHGKDNREAVKWYRLAAAQGNADAQYYLGVMYSYGQGVSQDYREVAKWYRLAAKQGNADAQSSLGAMYYHGRGVPQDYREAVKWHRMAAASQGHADAQRLLGEMYDAGAEEGSAVPKFNDYPAGPIYTGPVAKLDRSSDLAKRFRTRLGAVLTDIPVFAGEYVSATWGCGTSCAVTAFLSKHTGKVLGAFGGENGQRITAASTRADSKLLISEGPILDKDDNPTGIYAAYFYLLEDGQLKLLRKTPIRTPDATDW